MLKILKDCVLSGVQVHAGEIYPSADFRENDIQIVLGLGFAQRFTPQEPEEPVDAVPEEPEDFTVSPVLSAREAEPTSAVQASPAASPARGQKKKKAKK